MGILHSCAKKTAAAFTTLALFGFGDCVTGGCIPMKVFDIRSVPEVARIQARALYDTSTCSLNDIAQSLAISPKIFRQLRHFWGWPARPPRVLRHMSAEDLPNLQEPCPAPVALAAQIEAQLGRELAAVEAMLQESPASIQPAAAAEKRARTIGSLVRALVELRRLDPVDIPTGRLIEEVSDGFPSSLDELRTELAQRLDKLRQAGDD
jgi:hypothetical protein